MSVITQGGFAEHLRQFGVQDHYHGLELSHSLNCYVHFETAEYVKHKLTYETLFILKIWQLEKKKTL